MTRFILNNTETCIDLPAGLSVLDYLRHNQRLTGTKEGCREGDCGACVTLIGELWQNKMRYLPVATCLTPLCELHGKHLVTIEGLSMDDLSPVQQAILDKKASQCGFCTPGITVSLTGLLMQLDGDLSEEQIKRALSGHLCRCTGYSSLKLTLAPLKKRMSGRTGIDALLEMGMLPDYFRSIPERLKRIPLPEIKQLDQIGSDDIPLAGGTDLYAQHRDKLTQNRIVPLNLYPELKGIRSDKNAIRVGALTTFESFAQDPEIRRIIPGIENYIKKIASWQIRNRATIGGNIINASPIGDITILLLTMGAELILQQGKSQRVIQLSQFYKGYKQTDKKSDEILTEIRIPIPEPGSLIHFEKISKRRHLDIASVNSAIKIRVNKNQIQDARIGVGGVAPIPLLLGEVGQKLIGCPVSVHTVRQAASLAIKSISPIDDIRGSAAYKQLLTRQLIIAHFTLLFPDQVKARDFYEAD
ncbi:MAG: hypothetical protein B6244_09460 [Candidatus Cloacimonetes bacterium 4572_55]|nr:MAG: hypothetical protein B6244_09460 [Candidatus Cloacimonetes bacterium 4572_55]